MRGSRVPRPPFGRLPLNRAGIPWALGKQPFVLFGQFREHVLGARFGYHWHEFDRPIRNRLAGEAWDLLCLDISEPVKLLRSRYLGLGSNPWFAAFLATLAGEKPGACFAEKYTGQRFRPGTTSF
jgi:hypothetical protein